MKTSTVNIKPDEKICDSESDNHYRAQGTEFAVCCCRTTIQGAKLKSVILSVFIIFIASESTAQQFHQFPRFELGIVLGEPSGLSAKWWLSPMSAIDFMAAWSFSEDGIFETNADYLFHFFAPEFNSGILPVYIGPGISIRIGSDWFVGARFPIGIEYIFNRFPITLFGEIAPQWQIFPDDKFIIGGGAGIRLKFGSID
ncbi:MAG: hypothetical protein GX640_23820 [Fibrobacter sp.]|nr:hypothetical protein [Fibrobacter sp.]